MAKTPRSNKTFRADRRNRCKENRHVWPGIRPKFRLELPQKWRVYPYNSKKRNHNADAV